MERNALDTALRNRRSCRAFSERPLTTPYLLRICRAAQGITGPDGKRTAPSANGLHPLKTGVSLGPSGGRAAAIHTFDPLTCGLTQARERDARLKLASATLGDQDWLAKAPAILTFLADLPAISDAFKDQPPQGARGERYAYIEAGAAAQNAMLAAADLGVGSVVVAGFDDALTSVVFDVAFSGRPLQQIALGWRAGRH